MMIKRFDDDPPITRRRSRDREAQRTEAARKPDEEKVAAVAAIIERSQRSFSEQKNRLDKIKTMSPVEQRRMRIAIGKARHELRLMERIVSEFDDA